MKEYFLKVALTHFLKKKTDNMDTVLRSSLTFLQRENKNRWPQQSVIWPLNSRQIFVMRLKCNFPASARALCRYGEHVPSMSHVLFDQLSRDPRIVRDYTRFRLYWPEILLHIAFLFIFHGRKLSNGLSL